jgi:hypothetical protein
VARTLGFLLGAFGLLILNVGAARGFSLLGDPPTIEDVQGVLEEAARWPSPDGQRVVLDVASMPGFGAALSSIPEEIASANQVVADAFAAWGSPALQFNLSLEDPGVEGLTAPDPNAGFDIDVFAVPDSHPAFASGSAFGIAFVSRQSVPSRLLTNGQAFPGSIIVGADVYINIDMVLPFKTGIIEVDAAALQRLLMHEIGHALGLGHPNYVPEVAAANLDTDSDPLNVMVINPADPFADLIVSPSRDDEAVMSSAPCLKLPCAAMLFPLRNDDLGGRDVLYPDMSALGCPELPDPGCTENGLNITLLQDKESPGTATTGPRGKLVFKWVKGSTPGGAGLQQSDFGDVLTEDLHLCFYEDDALVLSATAPAGDSWVEIPGKGYRYVDKAMSSDGIKKVILKGGGPGKGKVLVFGKGSGLPLPSLPLGGSSSFDVQVHIDNAPLCFGMSYTAGGGNADVFVNKDVGLFKLKRKGP